MSTEEKPFADLPAGLVEEILSKTSDVGDRLLSSFNELKQARAARRQDLVASKMLRHESSLGYPPLPTTCATESAGSGLF